MKPIKLTMQAFGSYGKRCELDFTKPTQNLFLITGDTGAGKTTIFDALVFAVYGEASSNSNRKDGTELQSQFADYDVTPYVEFTFSKGCEGIGELYTVRRTPRHLRSLKRGKGFAVDSETVSLTLPDGSEYAKSSKEIDSKLEEIIGLTKDQFMQVAMIAQGEFMELLRTKSDAKKLIFRKLFNTDIFQKIIDEFAVRRKKSQTELAKIKTIFKTEARNILIYNDIDGAVGLNELKNTICSDEAVTANDMDDMLLYLGNFCDKLKPVIAELEAEYKTIYKSWEDINESYIKAQTIKTAYEQLDRAEKILADCNSIDNKAREEFAQYIIASYEIKNEYKRLYDAELIYAETNSRLDEYRKLLPELFHILLSAEKFDTDKLATDKLIADIKEAHSMKKRISELDAELSKLREEYAVARNNYKEKNNELNIKQTMYLDSRAGFIAKESLRDGEPCPVCGSLEHPSPCALSDEHKDITRTLLDKLRSDADILRGEQEVKAAKAEGEAKLLEELCLSYNSAVQSLVDRLCELGGKECVCKDLTDVINLAKNMKDNIDDRGNELNRTLLNLLENHAYLGDLPDRLEEKYNGFDNFLEKSKSAKDRVETLISECERTLPLCLENMNNLRSSYNALLSEKNIDESKWRTVVSQYSKKDAEKMMDDAALYNQTKASALSSIETAKATISDTPRPIIDDITEKLKFFVSARDNLGTELSNTKAIYENNMRILSSLSAEAEKRKAVMAMHKKLDELYSLLSGNMSGQRMDIETYVQRHYLERILEYANIRFRDMSAGQFELRMYDIAKAGEGKNRGLDLMVYSTVTGKEREVRTLSGGESFMAALSLALGMADQISQSSSALSLDLMFIDEGFGSLDEHSRNQAVKVLKQMADSTKIIGIISHVSELKQEIDNQLVVRKTDHGSVASWQIS